MLPNLQNIKPDEYKDLLAFAKKHNFNIQAKRRVNQDGTAGWDVTLQAKDAGVVMHK